MTDSRRDHIVAALRRAMFTAPGDADPAVRAAAATGGKLPEDWEPYVAAVRDHPDQVGDEDVARLRATGHSEDEIFEVTAAAAVGAAFRSFDAGLRALDDATRHPG